MPTCDNWIEWPPTALGIAPTFAPMPKPLSRIQLVTVRLPRPPEPAVAASAPIRPQSIGCGSPEKLKKPGEGPPPVRRRHERHVHRQQEQKHHGEHRPGEALEHALDGAAEGKDQHDEGDEPGRDPGLRGLIGRARHPAHPGPEERRRRASGQCRPTKLKEADHRVEGCPEFGPGFRRMMPP